MKTYSVSACLAFMLATLSLPLFASGLGWLGDAPIRYFSEKDSELMKSSVQKALNSNDDGVKLEWENPETGHKGSVTPLDRKKIQGLICRDAQIFNSAGGRTANSRFTLCQHEDGAWKLANK